jgi:hypothetical protein
MIYLRLPVSRSSLAGLQLVTTLSEDHRVEPDNPRDRYREVPPEVLDPLIADLAPGSEWDRHGTMTQQNREQQICASLRDAVVAFSARGAIAKLADSVQSNEMYTRDSVAAMLADGRNLEERSIAVLLDFAEETGAEWADIRPGWLREAEESRDRCAAVTA